MYSALGPLCHALDANKTNIAAHKDIMLQYLSGLELDLQFASVLANDTLFPQLLQNVIDTILRTTFPAPCESPIPPVQLQALNFLTFLCLNHPTLLSTIASSVPLDYMIPVFFDRNIENDRIADLQAGTMLPILQFLAAVSSSSTVNIASTESLHQLFSACISSIASAQLAPWAIATIAGFARNSTAALSFLKALPNLAHLKREIAALLSSNDHSLVVASLSAVTALFCRGIDKETVMRVSFSAVISPPQISVGTTLAASVVLQLIDETELSEKEVEQLLRAATSSHGMRAYVLYKLILEAGGKTHQHLLNILQSERAFSNFVSSILSCEDGFVTVAGSHLLTTLFENAPMPVGIDISDPFAAALKIVLSNKIEDLDRIEAMLLIMRMLVQLRESMTHIVRLLKDNEEAIFVAFQRFIESNHSFVAMHFFLFIYSASHFFKHWTIRMREIVVDSQFTALLVHVMTSASNRQVIQDALVVMHLMMTGINPSAFEVDAPLFDTLIGGFYLLNKKEKQELAAKDAEMKQIQNNYVLQIQEMEVEKDLHEKEIATLREQSNQSLSQISSDRDRISDLEMQNDYLKKHLKSRKVKLAAAMEALKNSENELNSVSIQLCQQEQEASLSTAKSEKLKTRVLSMKQVEVERQNVQKKCDQLEQKLKETTEKLEEALQDVEAAVAQAQKERTRRKEAENLLQETQDRVNQLASQYDQERSSRSESDRQNQRLEGMIKKKNECELQALETINEVKQELEKYKADNDKYEQENTNLRTQLQKMRKQMIDLKKDRKDLAALAQMIHRITDGTLENVGSLATMIQNDQL